MGSTDNGKNMCVPEQMCTGCAYVCCWQMKNVRQLSADEGVCMCVLAVAPIYAPLTCRIRLGRKVNSNRPNDVSICHAIYLKAHPCDFGEPRPVKRVDGAETSGSREVRGAAAIQFPSLKTGSNPPSFFSIIPKMSAAPKSHPSIVGAYGNINIAKFGD